MIGAREKIWIIGGSSGIGEAMARAYAARGALVVISGRDEKALEAALTRIGPGQLAARADAVDNLFRPDAIWSDGQPGPEASSVGALQRVAGLRQLVYGTGQPRGATRLRFGLRG